MEYAAIQLAKRIRVVAKKRSKKSLLNYCARLIFARQGHYALDPATITAYPPADLTVERIGDLARWDRSAFLDAGQYPHPVERTAPAPGRCRY